MNKPRGITTLRVEHNIEVAHRLSKTPGKCQQIHGHSMWVELEMLGQGLDVTGKMVGMEYGDLKRVFRHHLDTQLDHHLLLSKDDPWADSLVKTDALARGDSVVGDHLPGLALCTDDPTTENIAKWIGEWAYMEFGEGLGIQRIQIVVHETRVNAATWTVECPG